MYMYMYIPEDSMILKRWTEYCNELYNHKINPDIRCFITRHNKNR